MFYVSADRDVAIAQIPKAGIHTIEEWLGTKSGFVLATDEDAMKVSRRVAFIRHPVERLKSSYSFMYWLKEYGSEHDSKPAVHSWAAFVDFALANDNGHWRPQHLIVNGVPNIYHRFENIGEHFEKYRPGILPHNNRATRLPTDDYRAGDIAAFYADDLRLWESAT